MQHFLLVPFICYTIVILLHTSVAKGIKVFIILKVLRLKDTVPSRSIGMKRQIHLFCLHIEHIVFGIKRWI